MQQPTIPSLTIVLLTLCGITETCRRHTECAGEASLCFKRRCIAAEPLPFIINCHNDRQCYTSGLGWRNRGRGCKYGICYSLITTPGNTACNNQRHCFGQSICIERRCIPAEPTDQFCKHNVNCGRGKYCISGMCFRPVAVAPSSGENDLINYEYYDY